MCAAPSGRVEAPKHRHGTDTPRLVTTLINAANASMTTAASISPGTAVTGITSNGTATASAVTTSTATTLVRFVDTTVSCSSQAPNPANAALLRTFDQAET